MESNLGETMKPSPNKLKNLMTLAGSRILNAFKTMIRVSVTVAIYAVLICGILILSLKAPTIHNHWLREKVGQKVYMIKDSMISGGGTGFAVKAPSGDSYIVTNDHVCGVSKDGQTVLVVDENGDIMRRNIIAHDEYSDLCLIEGMSGVKGLDISKDEPEKGDKIYVVGHPHLLPLAVNSGEMIGTEDVSIKMGAISMFNPQTKTWDQLPIEKGAVLASQCEMPKNTQVQTVLDLMIVKLYINWCIMTVKDAYITTTTVLPGNSGSPAVNMWGQVTGVVFATDEASWGRIVSLYDLNSFLKNY